MNEVKVSTQSKSKGSARISIKMNMEKLGVDWKASDIIRVMSYKDDNSIILKKVGKKVSKTVSHTLTKTGGGNFGHNLGLFVTHKPTRFSKDFKTTNSVTAASRFLDEKKTMLQVYLPKEIFV